MDSAPDPIPSPPLMFRPPSNSAAHASRAASFVVPSIPFLTVQPWRVTHSTLPMWKSSRNVCITYKTLHSSESATNPAEILLDDLVTYQKLNADKLKSVRGIDTPNPSVAGAYHWRGKGLLMVASSNWEILGYGEEEGGWAVTYFQKTLFTPAGIDIYARRNGGLSVDLLERIKIEMAKDIGAGDSAFKDLIGGLFDVRHDWEKA